MKQLFLDQRIDTDAPVDMVPCKNMHGKVSTRAVRREQYVYKVKKVVGATRPAIGHTLSADQVNDYCADVAWKVTIS